MLSRVTLALARLSCYKSNLFARH